jgi:hypothetical protein
VSVQNSFKKCGLEVNFEFENFFTSTFEAVLYIFRKDFPDCQIVVDNIEKNLSEESDTEVDARIGARSLVKETIFTISEKDSKK